MITAKEAKGNVKEALDRFKGGVTEDVAIGFVLPRLEIVYDQYIRQYSNGGHTSFRDVLRGKIENSLRECFQINGGAFIKCPEDYQKHLIDTIRDRFVNDLLLHGYIAQCCHYSGHWLDEDEIEVMWSGGHESLCDNKTMITACEAREIVDHAMFRDGNIADKRAFVLLVRSNLMNRLDKKITDCSNAGETYCWVSTQCTIEYEVKEAFRSAGERIVSRKQFEDLVKLSADDIVSFLQNIGYDAEIRKGGISDELCISWGDKE